MRSTWTKGTVVFAAAITLAARGAAAPIPFRPVVTTRRGLVAFPRPTGAILGPGVTRPSGAIPGPGVTRPTGATLGPGVPRATGATQGPDVGRLTGATFGPGVRRPSGATLGPDVTRPTGATLGPGVGRPTGAILGPEVTRPTGSTPGPGVPRATGAIPGPNVGRPTGAPPSDRDLVRPSGPTFGFTFGPLFMEPFRAGDRFPSNEAIRAGRERTDLSTEAPAPAPDDRLDLLTDAPAPVRPERADLTTDAPALPRRARPDLSTELPAPPRSERADLLTDQRPQVVISPMELMPPGEIVGGTFTGGAVGTAYSWLFGADRMGAWRIFDQPAYRRRHFATRRPLARWGPPVNRGWTVSGRASMGPRWSALRSDPEWAMSGRAGYGPDWSALREW